MHPPVAVQVRRARQRADQLPLPTYETEHAAGMDLRADLDAELVLAPLERAAVPTGLVLTLPPGQEAQVRPRSGLAKNHLVTVLDSPGEVRSGEEVTVLLINLAASPFTIRRGDRIAQLVVARVDRAEWQEVEVLEDTERGDKGFGSTGRD